MTNAKKIISVIALTVMLVLGLFTAVYAVVKGFDPLMIPADKEKLPNQVSESDLEDGYISTHKLMEVSKDTGEIIFLDSTNGRTYEVRHNMVLSSETVVETAKDSEEPSKENEKPEGEEASGAVETAATSQPSQSQPQQTTTPVVQTPQQQTPATQTQQPEPTHQHVWVKRGAVTEQRWIEDKPAWSETVLVKEAWDETVEVVTYCEGDPTIPWECQIKTQGGLVFPTEQAWSEWVWSLSIEEFETTPTNYTRFCPDIPVITTEIIHHDAEYNTIYHEAEGHYETVIITPAYEECACGAKR